jgi:hypothetical protein
MYTPEMKIERFNTAERWRRWRWPWGGRELFQRDG